jgi:hypothetical protein
VFINLICYQVMSPASLRPSNIIHSTTSTTMNKPRSKSSPHNSLLFILLSANGDFSWTLVSCVHLRPTTHILINQLIRLSAPMMGTLHTSLSSMRHPGMLGSSSHNLKTLLLTLLVCGCIPMDQGGKLASSVAFRDLLLRDLWYTLEPTGADSPSQNRAVEIYNDKLGIRTRSLLYGMGLPAKYSSAALVHLVYLHNRLVHLAISCTPFKYYYRLKLDLQYQKTFGSWVCVRQTGDQRAKLDHPVSFWATHQQTKTSFIWTWTQDLLSVAIMPPLMRRGTYNLLGHRRHSSYITWALRLRRCPYWRRVPSR